MEIVVLDGFAVNPGDLSWDEIAAFGNLTVFERTKPEEILPRCRSAEIILTNKVPLTQSILGQLSAAKMIGVLATGYNVIDIPAAKEKKIIVCNVPAYGTASVAQHAIALMLELTNQVGLHAASVRRGEWHSSPDWSYAKTPLVECRGKCLGVVGLGNIGRQTARIAKAMGMKIVYTGPKDKRTALGRFVTMEELFSRADFISLHCPLKPENVQFVNSHLIGRMKSTACLINTARGQLINEADLALALNTGRIAGAGLDVLSAEPPEKTNPLFKARNCIITPHNAWMSREARERILKITAGNIRAFINKHPIHRVDE